MKISRLRNLVFGMPILLLKLPNLSETKSWCRQVRRFWLKPTPCLSRLCPCCSKGKRYRVRPGLTTWPPLLHRGESPIMVSNPYHKEFLIDYSFRSGQEIRVQEGQKSNGHKNSFRAIEENQFRSAKKEPNLGSFKYLKTGS